VSPEIDPLDYLLGELSEAQLIQAERLMREDVGFRSELERLRPVVAELQSLPGELWEVPDPPPLRHPDRDLRPDGSPGIFERLLGSVSLPVPVAAAAALALAAAGAFIGTTLSDSGGDGFDGGQQIVLSSLDGEPFTGTAQVSADRSSLRLDVSALEPNSESDVYELWLLTPPAELVSLGTFKVDDDGAGSVQVPLSIPVSDFQLLDVSREPLDGDPGHSSDSVLRGNTT